MELWTVGSFAKVSHSAGAFFLILEREGEMQSARTRKQMTGVGMEGERVYVFAVQNETWATTPALMQRILSELRKLRVLGRESRMGDLLRSPYISLIFLGTPCVSPIFLQMILSTLRATWIIVRRFIRKCESRSRGIYKWCEREERRRNVSIYSAKLNRCDHTSTNAPDPIKTTQLSVLGRE